MPKARDAPAPHTRAPRACAGSVLIPVLVVFVLLGVMITAAVLSGGRDQDLGAARIQGARADTGAQSIAHMAARELMRNQDVDGDGAVGSISNDGNTATDPVVGGARGWATRAVVGEEVEVTAKAVSGSAVRATKVFASLTPTGADTVYIAQKTPRAVMFSALNHSTLVWAPDTTSGLTPEVSRYIAAAYMNDKTIILASDDKPDLYYGLADSATGVATYTKLCNDIYTMAARPFAVTTEAISGEGLIVYFNKAAPKGVRYRTVINNVLSAEMTVPVTVGDSTWVKIVSMGSSTNECMMLVGENDKDIHAARWTGSAWTDVTLLSSNGRGPAFEFIDLAVESVSGRVMAAFTDGGAKRFSYCVYTPGVGWSAMAQVINLKADIVWLRLTSRPGTNEIFIAMQGGDNWLLASRWDGTSWSTYQEIANTANDTRRTFDIGTSTDGSTVMIMYGKAKPQLYHRFWDGTQFGAELQQFTITADSRLVTITGGHVDAIIVGGATDKDGRIFTFSFNGTTPGTLTHLDTTDAAQSVYDLFGFPVRTQPVARLKRWYAVAP